MDTDFIGFSYGGINSRDFDLYRVSVSNRYEEQLIPQFNENKTAVPGGDGTYFFDANYTQRQFKVSFAFDSLTETQYRQLRLWLGNKDTFKQLIFDERPYKYYMAKPSAPPTLKTICFSETYVENGVNKTRRIYKGEGDITFVCYYPFAKTINGLKYENQFGTVPLNENIQLYYNGSLHSPIPFTSYSTPSDFPGSWTPKKSKVSYELRGEKYSYLLPDFFKLIFNTGGSNPQDFSATSFTPFNGKFYTTLKRNIELSSFTQYALTGLSSNLAEWKESTNWLESQNDFDQFQNGTAYLYNPGDLSADYKITMDYIPQTITMQNTEQGSTTLVHFTTQTMPTITIPTTTISNGVEIATSTTITADRIQIDSKTNMIKVGTSVDSTSTAAVDFVPVEMFNTAADVINLVTIPIDKIDPFIGVPTNTADANTSITITGGSGSRASIDYDYLYF